MNYRKELIEQILPFWLGDAIDRKEGGIFTCLDEEGKIYGEEKSVWFQGRALLYRECPSRRQAAQRLR